MVGDQFTVDATVPSSGLNVSPPMTYTVELTGNNEFTFSAGAYKNNVFCLRLGSASKDKYVTWKRLV